MTKQMTSCYIVINNYKKYLVNPEEILQDILNTKITNITNNSKQIKQNGIFFVINENSLKYIQTVLAIKPLLIISDISFKEHKIIQDTVSSGNIVIFSQNINIRKLYGLFVTIFYDFKKFPLKIVAITGTNGKSSSTFFYKQLCNFAGLKSCSIGTIGIYSDDEIKYQENQLTAPDISDLCEIIYQKASKGIFDIAIEASSHGLDQYRLDGVPLEVAGFTNFTQDHLDYHKTMDSYWDAKKRLFAEIVDRNKKIVINNDDEKSIDIKNICFERGIQYITIGIKNESDIQILDYQLTDNLTYKISINIFDKQYSTEIKTLGEFQLYNLIIAIACFHCTHPDKIELLFFKDGGGDLKNLQAPPGRMDIIYLQNNSIAIIDYAHTPDALENLLISSRKLLKNDEKLLLVFGCGGDRDKEKRVIMGKIASKYSDFIILTDDNPRNENPDDIRKEISDGIENNNVFLEIGDRKNAIQKAIFLANQYKIIVIAGKGHEKKQIIGDNIIDFDDKEILLQIINK
jgi:UDP-N-acetylmuramoyl-L-alanyl-D-glutamate--2,6-diaminopimelate ligase